MWRIWLVQSLLRKDRVSRIAIINSKKKIQTWLIWLDQSKTIDHYVIRTEFILAYGLRRCKGIILRILPDQLSGIRNIKSGIIFNLPWINLRTVNPVAPEKIIFQNLLDRSGIKATFRLPRSLICNLKKIWFNFVTS